MIWILSKVTWLIIDSIMTEDDYLVLKKYRKEKSANEFVSHEDLKKELGL